MSTPLYKVARAGKEFAEVDEVGLRDGLKSGRILGSDHCWTAGFNGWQRVDAVVAQLGSSQHPQPAAAPAPAARPKASAPLVAPTPSPQTDTSSSLVPHLWGVLIVWLFAWAAHSAFYTHRWDYLTLRVLTSQQSERNGLQAMRYSSIDAENLVDQLRARGEEGWEVVGVSLEMETAWPNFGRDDYVTGLQPNIRPQSMLVILKRRRPLF